MENTKVKDHRKTKLILRITGGILFPIGLILIIIAIVNFMSSMQGNATPTLVWLFFVAVPLMFIGGVCLLFGFMGAMTSYSHSQIRPVAKDSAIYMIDVTREEIVKTVKAIKEDDSK